MRRKTVMKEYLYVLIAIGWLIGVRPSGVIQAVEIEEYQNQTDETFLSGDIQIEIFAKNDDYFSQRMTHLFIPQLSNIDGKGVQIRMYDVTDASIHQYLLNLITFFNPITPDYLDNPVIVINNKIMVTGYTDLNNDQVISLIEDMIRDEMYSLPAGVGVYELKKADYEPNMYFSLRTNQVEPKRPNEVWYEQLPTFIFMDVEGFEKVSDTKWQQATSHVEVFVDEDCKECTIVLNQSLLELVPYLEENGGAIRIYNLNHEDVLQYLTEFSSYFDYKVTDRSRPIVIVNRQVLIEGYNIKRPKTYQDVIKKLLSHESDLPFLDGITFYPVLSEKKEDAQTIYFSEGLSKLAHQISQDPIELPTPIPIVDSLVTSDNISQFSISKFKLSIICLIVALCFVVSDFYIRVKKRRIQETQDHLKQS